MAKVKAQTKNQRQIDDLAWRCIKFVDSNPPGSKILGRGSNPFSGYLHMGYKNGDLIMEFRVQNSPYSNGSSCVLVRLKREIVFKAEGNFITRCYDMKVKRYVPGHWEKRIPKISN